MKNIELIYEDLRSIDEEIIISKELENALIGYIQLANTGTRALYDKDKCIEILMNNLHIDENAAIDYLEYNYINAYHGENSPAFATLYL